MDKTQLRFAQLNREVMELRVELRLLREQNARLTAAALDAQAQA